MQEYLMTMRRLSYGMADAYDKLLHLGKYAPQPLGSRPAQPTSK